jgi:diguanylate cyclase (GGDEF)-like protein
LAVVADLSEHRAKQQVLEAKVADLQRRLEDSQSEAAAARAAFDSEISEGVRPLLRSSDVAARYGGDEIVVLAPETSIEGGHTLAERILDRVRTSAMLSIETKSLSLGISIGVAVCPLHAAAPEDLVASADRAMYQAKRQGGGRVCFAELHP